MLVVAGEYTTFFFIFHINRVQRPRAPSPFAN